jgi:glycerate dehydrogenase
MNPINIVALDSYTLNPGDLSWEVIEKLGNFKYYDRTSDTLLIERAENADILLVNKILITKRIITALPRLKCICVTATGYNNIDLSATQDKGIIVCNAVGYGVDSVAQHVFALILALTNGVEKHNESVKKGDWGRQSDFCYTLQPIIQLAGKTMGIYGYGRIGQKVAEIALAFGMQVLIYHRSPEKFKDTTLHFVDLMTLFQQSDIISLHAPLSPDNEQIVNKALLQVMRPTAYLINTARGGLVNEQDLKKALIDGQIAGAALDVVHEEPPTQGNLLFDVPNCIVTPHIAWASKNARQNLIHITAENIEAFLNGKPKNVVF